MPLNTSYLKQRVIEVSEAKSELKRLTSKTYVQLSVEEKYAIRYQVIVLAEALGSICLHVATEDFKLKPQSYVECFKIMEERNVCSDCSEDLTAIVRLRNLLAHRYWSIDDMQVYDSIKNDFKGVDRFIGSVREKYAVSL